MNDLLQRTDSPSSSPDIQTLIRIKRMLLYTYEDEQYLVKAGSILQPYTESILHGWYEYLLANNYLSLYFTKNGMADKEYLELLKPQFTQWIGILCNGKADNGLSQFEARILNYMEKSEDINAGLLPFTYLRYLTTFIFPVVEAGKKYLTDSGSDAKEIANMQQAWFKAVCFSVLLWIYPASVNQA
jgi:hypothetical protein